MTQQSTQIGHRERLRQRFLNDASLLSDVELIELVLTYAIPRRDVAEEARVLLSQFGSVEQLLTTPLDELRQVQGIGTQASILIKTIAQIVERVQSQDNGNFQIGLDVDDTPERIHQPQLFELESTDNELDESVERSLHTFVNDEIANSLAFIPQSPKFDSYTSFKTHLFNRLPYNSLSTRKRRANHILNRFYPNERIDTPLTYYVANCSSEVDLKPVIFYHVLKAEPMAAKVAEELIYPALPIGHVERETMRAFILRHLPEIGTSSQKNMLRSLFTTYELLNVGTRERDTLYFQGHAGTPKSFLYILTCEFPQAGMHTFDKLEKGPMRHWLLWDREWMRQQLYHLREARVVEKISEIDTMRQFTLSAEQMELLNRYFTLRQ